MSDDQEAIEAQHQQVLEAIERYDASNDQAGVKIERLLEYLEVYTRNHFALEEQAMAAKSYPGAAPHIAAHREVRQKVEAVRARFKAEGPTPSVEDALRSAVGAMLTDQMVTHDRALKTFLKGLKA